MQGFEYRQEGRGAGVAGIRREIEQNDRDLAIPSLGAAHCHQARGARRQHVRALAADMHLAGDVGAGEDAGTFTSGAGHPCPIGAAAIDHRTRSAVEFRDRHHDGALHRHQAAIRCAPLFERLEFHGVRREIGHVQRGENFLGRLGVVVGGATDQREAGQRDHRIDRAAAVLHEEAFDRRPLIETAGESRDHPQPSRLERRDYAVIMTGISGQQIRTQQEDTDGAAFARQFRQAFGRLGDAAFEAWMVDPDVGVFDRRLGLDDAAQAAARAIGVAVHQQADHVGDVLLGPRQPVLQGQEVGAHVLRGAGNEAQQLWQLPQHLHFTLAAGV